MVREARVLNWACSLNVSRANVREREVFPQVLTCDIQGRRAFCALLSSHKRHKSGRVTVCISSDLPWELCLYENESIHHCHTLRSCFIGKSRLHKDGLVVAQVRRHQPKLSLTADFNPCVRDRRCQVRWRARQGQLPPAFAIRLFPFEAHLPSVGANNPTVKFQESVRVCARMRTCVERVKWLMFLRYIYRHLHHHRVV